MTPRKTQRMTPHTKARVASFQTAQGTVKVTRDGQIQVWEEEAAEPWLIIEEPSEALELGHYLVQAAMEAQRESYPS